MGAGHAAPGGAPGRDDAAQGIQRIVVRRHPRRRPLGPQQPRQDCAVGWTHEARHIGDVDRRVGLALAGQVVGAQHHVHRLDPQLGHPPRTGGGVEHIVNPIANGGRVIFGFGIVPVIEGIQPRADREGQGLRSGDRRQDRGAVGGRASRPAAHDRCRDRGHHRHVARPLLPVRRDQHRRQMLAAPPQWAGASAGNQQRPERIALDGDALRIRVGHGANRGRGNRVAIGGHLQILHTPPQFVDSAFVQRFRAEQAFDDLVAERQIGGRN